ncbi:MAG: copper resistance protein CopC [Aeromicrobium sp.]
MARSLAMLIFAVLFLPTAAIAHSEAVETDPKQGAQLTTLPTEASITFDETTNHADLVLTTPDGKVHALKARIADSTVTAVLPSVALRGEYRLAYRVVSADGHPVSGSVSFDVTTGATVAKPAPTATPRGDVRQVDRAFPVPTIAVLGLAVAALIALALLAARRTRR